VNSESGPKSCEKKNLSVTLRISISTLTCFSVLIQHVFIAATKKVHTDAGSFQLIKPILIILSLVSFCVIVTFALVLGSLFVKSYVRI
jgi:hypothetical protein